MVILAWYILILFVLGFIANLTSEDKPVKFKLADLFFAQIPIITFVCYYLFFMR